MPEEANYVDDQQLLDAIWSLPEDRSVGLARAVLQTSRASRRASRSHEKVSFSTVLDTSQEDSTLLENARHAPLPR
jgi:hypothetical protein